MITLFKAPMNKLWIVLLLSSCAGFKPTLNIHPQAAKYVNKFNYLMKSAQNKEISNLEVHFSTKLPYSTLAVCVREPFTTPVVYLNYYYWNELSYLRDLGREEIIFHELGHCVLNREHTAHKDSVMYPYHLGASRYQLSYSKYISELFKSGVSRRVSRTQTFSSTLVIPKYEAKAVEPSWPTEALREVIMIKDIEDIAQEQN